ncbi:YacL family protein [Pasteurellaceae bacterium TAE3-ERU1]|nr:YacL family protein [Pasteurellaceae bacterium TAE3-ERU1]
MDYQFSFDATHTLVVKCSMGHEAIARWASDELPHSAQAINALKARIERAIAHHQSAVETVRGHEFDLIFDGCDVCVQAHSLGAPCDEMFDDALHEYDAELVASCGSDDFVAFLEHLQAFLAGR